MADAWVYGWIGRRKDRKENGEVYMYMDIRMEGWLGKYYNFSVTVRCAMA